MIFLLTQKAGKHLAAWKNFNKKIGNNDAVGIYHETLRGSKKEVMNPFMVICQFMD